MPVYCHTKKNWNASFNLEIFNSKEFVHPFDSYGWNYLTQNNKILIQFITNSSKTMQRNYIKKSLFSHIILVRLINYDQRQISYVNIKNFHWRITEITFHSDTRQKFNRISCYKHPYQWIGKIFVKKSKSSIWMFIVFHVEIETPNLLKQISKSPIWRYRISTRYNPSFKR